MTRSVHREMCRRGIERRKPSSGCRCFLDQQKAIWRAADSRDDRRPRVVVDPGMHTSLLRGNREISIASPPVVAGRLTGRLGAIAANEYDGEVGLARGSGEAGEQGGLGRCGVCGAKGGAKENADQLSTVRTQRRAV